MHTSLAGMQTISHRDRVLFALCRGQPDCCCLQLRLFISTSPSISRCLRDARRLLTSQTLGQSALAGEAKLPTGMEKILQKIFQGIMRLCEIHSELMIHSLASQR